MARIGFSPNFRRRVAVVASDVAASTVKEGLETVFARHPTLRGCVLDDRGAVRHHVAVFVNGQSVRDRRNLSGPLEADAEVFVMQALSGG